MRSILIKLKTKIKKILIKLLVLLDREFVPQLQSLRTKEHDLNTDSNLISNAVKTIIINENGLLTSREEVEFTIKAIFKVNEFDQYTTKLNQLVESNPGLWVNHHEITQFIKSELLKWSNSSDLEFAKKGAALLEKLLQHLSETTFNKSAYLIENRINSNAVFWPNPTNNNHPRSLYTESPWSKKFPIIDQLTPIGSAGSCFAFEIAHELQRNNFNYVITEPHINSKNGLSNSCARWGTIFNSPSFKQLVERAFNVKNTPQILWTQNRNGKTLFFDPFREDIFFESVKEYEQDLNKHIPLLREALLKVRVFVITLGVNEVWSLKSDGSVFAIAPWKLAPNLVESRVLSVEENLNELQSMLDLWRKFNPEIQLIVSVSPVPLHATFRGNDHHVVTANAHSKATLRVVAEEFVKRNHGVYYFPSYETVTNCTENAWDADQRHVSRIAVKNVMDLFKVMFIKTK